MRRAAAEPTLFPLLERLGKWSLERRGHRTRFVSTSEGRLHVYDARGHGPLPPFVLLHGIGATATGFAPILARLRRRARRVVAIEYPGHGFSDLPSGRLTPDRLFGAATEALDAVLEEPAIVCGNSLGGAVALQYAIARPSRVRALALLSPAGARLSDAELDALRTSFAFDTRADAVRFLARVYHEVPWFSSLLAHELIAHFGRPVVRDLLESASNDHAPTAEALAALPMPVLLWWGRSERLLPPSCLDWFRAHLPKHAIIEQPEGFGHSPHLDAPQVVADRLAAFARSLPRG